MKKNKLICLFFSVFSLVSCNEVTSSSQNSSSIDTSNITSSKDVLNFMKDNYSFNVRTRVKRNNGSYASYYYATYTPSYYLGKLSTSESSYKGYIAIDNEVADFEIVNENEEDKVIVSERLEENGHVVNKLYENSITSNLSALNLESFDGTTLKGKENIISLLNVSGFTSNDYLTIKDYQLNFTFDATKKELLMNFSTSKAGDIKEYTATFNNFGTAKNEKVDEYIKNGGKIYVASENQKTLRNLFKENNYLREQLDSNGNFEIREYFTKQYYYNDFSDEYLSQNPTLATYMLGYIYINKENLTLPGYKSLNYDDVYLFHISNSNTVSLVTREDPESLGNAQGGFTSKQSDVSYVMNYPSNLYLFKHFERFKENGEFLTTTDYDIIHDFINNFGITSSSDVTLLATSLDIDFHLDEDVKEEYVNFKLNCIDQNSSKEVIYEFNFSKFGITEHEAVTKFIKQYDIGI